MDIATTKLELMRQLLSIADEKTLRKVASFFKREVAIEEDEDLSEEEMAELEGRFQDMVSGKVKPISEKDSIRMIRAAGKAKG
ncbi:MAG TPA: hypothetical protein PKE21_11050 [Flavobacteriales bacterium]|nr:hypothetical protein [Flavobacteriales bacterium]HMR28006.1 hypothetical protein [Flavobacteriales bacterium]